MNLHAVQDALLADATAEADAIRDAARRDADGVVEAARRDAERMVAVARADGEAEARRVSAIGLARARREAREQVLSARRAAVERLLAAAARAAVALRGDAGYPELLDGLGRAARGQLGDDAVVRVDTRAGGLVATAGSRSVDYRLDVLADRCVEAMGSRIEALWR